MVIIFELNDGSDETFSNLDDGLSEHPVFESAFVADLLENHNEEDEALIIPLPAFIERNAFVQFCNHLNHHTLSVENVGFGKYAHLTFQGLNNNHPDYIRWAQQQEGPSDQMSDLLNWVDTIDTVRASWTTSQRDIHRIAKFFQVDLCSRCGLLGTENVRLSPCNRTSWPNVPNIPDYNEVVRGLDENDHQGRLSAWIAAWDAAETDAGATGRTVCTNDDLLCSTCISNSTLACRVCNSWECDQCQQDTDTLHVLERLHGEDPRIEEDENGRRDGSPRQKLQVHPCLNCRRRICHDCGTECSECHRRACANCKNRDNLNSLCEGCRDSAEAEDGDANDVGGLIDRDEWICRPCFDRQPHLCDCGEPSYDPNASDSETSNSEEDDSGDEYDYDNEADYFDDEYNYDDEDDYGNDYYWQL